MGLVLPRPRTASIAPPRGRLLQSGLVEPLWTHTYEAGVDAEPVVVGEELLAVMGSPTYSATNAAHGAMGWLSSAQTGGGRLMYASPAPTSSSGSVYVVPRELPPGNTVTVVGFWTAFDDSAPVCRIRLTADGRVDLTNGPGTRLAITKKIWAMVERIRLDWSEIWDGTTLTVSLSVYVGGNSEGWRPTGQLEAAFLAGSPSFLSLGAENNSHATVGFDTYREYDTATVAAPYEPVVGGALLHTFEDGHDGIRVTPGPDEVVAISGAPKFSAVAAMHGGIGVLIPATGGVVRYDNPYPPAHTGSVYVKSGARGNSDSPLVVFQHGSTTLAQVRITKDGRLNCADASGQVLCQTLRRQKKGQWSRVDWQQTWDGASLDTVVRYFATDAESSDNYVEMSATVPCDVIPDTLSLGTTTRPWKLMIDTVRTYGDINAWPPPFQPVTRERPTGLVAWAGDATQTTVEIAGYTSGATAVGLAISESDQMTDAVTWPSAPPNVAGWNKWSVTGLQPGTRYYHQLTDTPDGGEPRFVGAVSAFWTLKPEGVECTTTIACGSCAHDNPADPAAFNDIAAWGPDRMMHLGDLGYPNFLSRDPTTHMDNWAANVTDAGVSAVLAIACMDYIGSDHDDNGSGNNNMPTYNDPVTMANIAAWQDVVPARLEDTQVPAHGRWRSEVEGNVRFVKVDTRTIDKTDTLSASTDPRAATSTMLGATQLAWLQGQINAAAAAHQLIVLFTDCAWNGTSPGPPIPASYSDKWPSFIYERDLISDYAAAAGAQMFIVFGDSHGLQQDDGTHEKNGFASICCSPLDRPLHMHYQDAYQWVYPDDCPDGGGPYRSAQHYQRLTITQEVGSPVVTVTAEARDCSSLVPGTPMTVRSLTKVYQP